MAGFDLSGELLNAMKDVKQAVEEFNSDSSNLANRMIILSKIMVVLSILLVILTVVLIIAA